MTGQPDAEADDDERGDGERNDAEPDDAEHLDDIEDGAGCAEIWERLSERREAARNEAE